MQSTFVFTALGRVSEIYTQTDGLRKMKTWMKGNCTVPKIRWGFLLSVIIDHTSIFLRCYHVCVSNNFLLIYFWFWIKTQNILPTASGHITLFRLLIDTCTCVCVTIRVRQMDQEQPCVPSIVWVVMTIEPIWLHLHISQLHTCACVSEIYSQNEMDRTRKLKTCMQGNFMSVLFPGYVLGET